mmetsp:Transcript_1337/g.1749  ORF Transcript_1337/g.1749 Transcript_1337/m.1749 type:complete len:574 (+) Transcript_1337:57-1778(+)|eukprot:CAMPEP_0178924642 /NCGR_PEP_ID=MMETSP0786-20121207/17443_1 /TAXON_ID=186022 /ORGANISM="Thalassionema frauenfeldii, Strain CCMP 1798" /LENGTH=573 /DNA_ID=CAMNT_0020599381 /DNA_START=47 /DNA_END=1768 /DNA_ORIENTATION=-
MKCSMFPSWFAIALTLSSLTGISASVSSHIVEAGISFPLLDTAPIPAKYNRTWSTLSRVTVYIPSVYHNPAGEQHVAAAFGTGLKSHFRGSLAAQVKYVNSTLCQPLYVEEKNKTVPIYPRSATSAPFWLMVNRGGDSVDCSFVTKARMAQHMGAAGVIFADDRCLCSKHNCTTGAHDPPCQANTPNVVDDGSAGDVSIPAFLLEKTSADDLKSGMIDHGHPIYLEYKWGLAKDLQEQKAPLMHFSLWSTASPLDEPELDLVEYKHLKTLATKFVDFISFSPHYKLIDGKNLGCSEEAQCANLCTNKGRYCSASPREDIKGKDVVAEVLRRSCIWNHYGVDEITHKTGSPIWWDYVLFHQEHCAKFEGDSGNTYYSNKDCIENAYKHAKVDGPLIQQCMKDSGGLDEDRSNTWLEHALERQEAAGILSTPAITLNHKYQIDGYGSTSVFEAMCASYVYDASQSTMTEVEALKKVPVLCLQCFTCSNKIGCIEHDGKCVAEEFHTHHSADDDEHHIPSKGNANKKKSKSGFMMLFVLSLGVVGAAYFYKKNQDRFASSNGGGILNGYFQLNNQE